MFLPCVGGVDQGKMVCVNCLLSAGVQLKMNWQCMCFFAKVIIMPFIGLFCLLMFILQVRTVLDIGCGYGSFGAHLFSKQLLTMCIANYEASGSQVQLTLERGLPAMIGSFGSKQLPYPYLSFDMVHCARCGVDWSLKGIILIILYRLFIESKVDIFHDFPWY